MYNILNIVKIQDDFIFIASSHSEGQFMLDAFLSFANAICLSLSATKNVKPSQILIFIGTELNSLNMTASLPLEKLTLYRADLVDLLHVKFISLRNLQSIIGKLQFATSVVSPGRPFIRRLNNQTLGYKSLFKLNFTRVLGKILRPGLLSWTTIMESP